MNRFKTVFMFEFKSVLNKKTTKTATIVLALIIFAITFVPSLFSGSANESDSQTGYAFAGEVGFFFEDTADYNLLEPYLAAVTFSEYINEDALKAAVVSGDVVSGFAVTSLSEYRHYVNDRSLYEQSQSVYEMMVQEVLFNENLAEQGIDPAAVANAANIEIQSETITLGRDSTQGYIIGLAFTIIMYMLILLYGTNVSTSIAREKDSRTMELLITSTKPSVLILGKVLAVGLVGILQISLLILAAVIGYMINKGNYPEAVAAMLQGSMGWDVALVFVVFALAGYLLYLFIYAALGSLVSKVEDVNSAVTPITFLFVIAYFIATMAMQMPNAFFVKVSSYIPFVSLFTMPIRVMLSSVAVWEVLVSVAIILLTTAGIAYLSIYIYRFGSLNYGNRLKLKDVFASWRK